MPAPPRTSEADIVRAARELVESGGLAELTMASVAQKVGVRAPSLYKRVRDRDALIRLVIATAVAEIAELLAEAPGTEAAERLRAMAEALRRFAHANPEAFRLVFGAAPTVAGPDRETFERASAPVLAATTELAGPDRALDAARTVTAWLNGFLLMEISSAFRLGGVPEDAFRYGLERIVAAIRR